MPRRPAYRPKSSRRRRYTPFGAPLVPIVFLVILALAGVLLYQSWREGRIVIPNLPPPALPTVEVTLPAAANTPVDRPLATLVQDEPPLVFPSITRTAAPVPGELVAVYFTDPRANQDRGGIDTLLVEAVQRAQRSVDMAVYNLSLEDLADALVEAHRRGVRVRLVLDDGAVDRNVPDRLRAAGIPIADDGDSDGLMHSKFMVIDEQEVWTGSANFTGASFYRDDNNLVRLVSAQAAENYTTEFNEMFDEGLFGSSTRPATPYPQIEVGGIPVEIYFSPDDGAADQIVDEIAAAQVSVNFLAYSFTNDDIAEAVRRRADLGVAVRGVFDAEQVDSNTGGEFEAFTAEGYLVRRDGLDGLMHHKVIIIDGRTVITGSYNFSASAERRNDENLVVIHDETLAGQYLERFELIYAEAE